MMKTLFAVALIVSSFSALAINEVECTGRNSDGNRIDFLVNESWGNSNRDARYLVYVDSTPDETVYRVTTLRNQTNRRVYTGTEGVRLEVELGQDREPRWNIRYRGQLSVSYERIGTLSCRFAQVRP